MTRFHGLLQEALGGRYPPHKVSSQPCGLSVGAKAVSSGFPGSFRLADLLSTAVPPVGLSMPTPTRLINFR